MRSKTFFITLNWNGLADTLTCADAVAKQEEDHVLVIIDNGSEASEAEQLMRLLPEAVVLAQPVNTGFCRGNNIGIRYALAQADCTHLFILNNDAYPEAGCLRALLAQLRPEELISPLVLFSGTQVIQNAGGTLHALGFTRNRCKDWPRDRALPAEAPDYLVGCAVFGSSETFARLGGFDERFFAYFEDTALAWRARSLGINLRVVPEAVVFHQHSASLRGKGQIKTYLLTRNALLLARHYLKGRRRFLFQLLAPLFYGLLGLRRYGPGCLKAWFTGVLDGYSEVRRYPQVANVSTQKPLALLTPLKPFRGGIAQYGDRLLQALSQKSDLLCISFSRQYPMFLYPGPSDRDASTDFHRSSQIAYIIDTLNPFTWFSALRRLRFHGSSWVIIPWWTVYFAPLDLVISRVLRFRGTRILFLCHNVEDHESSRLKRLATRMVLRAGHAFLTHGHAEANQLRRLVPGAKVTVHPHPLYDQFPSEVMARPRRAALELLVFGFIRPYKGLDLLADALDLLPQLDFHLTVAGEWWPGLEPLKRRLQQASWHQRLELEDRYISDEEGGALFKRADVVLLPYHSATGSGIIPVAYHYKKPVIASAVGGIPEVVEHGVSGYLFKPGDAQDLARTISTFAEASQPWSQGIERVSARFQWSHLAETLLQAMGENEP